MLTFVLLSLSVAALLHLWFRTSFVAEYAYVLGIHRHLGLPDAKDIPSDTRPIVYPEVLAARMAGRGRFCEFLARMVYCPACAGLWIAVAVCCLAGQPAMSLAVYYAGLRLFLL